jgi:hypothetical protein
MLRLMVIALSWLALAMPRTALAENMSSKEALQSILPTIPYDVEYPDVEQRKSFALAIEVYWVDFDRRIPRLSPGEIEWVQSEISAAPERLSRVTNSKEYAILQLNKRTDTCLRNIRNVLQSYNSDQAKQTEMFYWLQMLNCYDGRGDTEMYLKSASIPHNDDAGQHVQVLRAEFVVQSIIVNKVASAAMAETMGWTLTPD